MKRLQLFFRRGAMLTLMIIILLLSFGCGGGGRAITQTPPPSAAPLVIIPAALFESEVGRTYSQQLSVSNGTAPFSWTILKGSLPAGVTLDPGKGLVSGAASRAGKFDFTVVATDSAGASGNIALTLTVNPASVVELPALTVDANIQQLPVQNILVSAGGNAQSAINGAPCGSVITLEAGVTFVGPLILPDKNCNGVYTTLRTSVLDGQFPPSGVRVTPADAALMPKVITNTVNQPAIKATSLGTGSPGGAYWILIGLDISVDDAVASSMVHFQNALVQLGQSESDAALQPHHIIVDRCYIHASPSAHARRGVLINGAFEAVINSHISEMHEEGSDSQAILGYNGPGPFLIENNRLEAGSENVMFGGAIGGLVNVIPSNITIRRNYFFKPARWKQGDPSYDGSKWNIKNLLEFKNAQRVLVEGNVFENSWANGQVGNAILFSPRVAQGQGWPNLIVSDITVRQNVISHVGAGFNIAAEDSNEAAPRPIRGMRFMIKNNLILDANNLPLTQGGSAGTGSLAQVLFGVPDLIIDHNTVFATNTAFNGELVPSSTPANRPNSPFTFTNNLANHAAFGVKCSGASAGTASLDACFSPPLYIFTHNVLVNPGSTKPSVYPSTNQMCGSVTCFPLNFVDAGLTDVGNCNAGNFDPSACKLTPSSSYKNAGTDGKDMGADIALILASTQGVKK